jgi:hypothetical protein
MQRVAVCNRKRSVRSPAIGLVYVDGAFCELFVETSNVANLLRVDKLAGLVTVNAEAAES